MLRTWGISRCTGLPLVLWPLSSVVVVVIASCVVVVVSRCCCCCRALSSSSCALWLLRHVVVCQVVGHCGHRIVLLYVASLGVAVVACGVWHVEGQK